MFTTSATVVIMSIYLFIFIILLIDYVINFYGVRVT